MCDTEEALILLKCRGCKTPTLFKLDIRHEADSTDYVAKSYCMGCEQDGPLQKLMVRSLEPALVDSQRIEPVCLEPDRSVDTGNESDRAQLTTTGWFAFVAVCVLTLGVAAAISTGVILP